MFEYYKNKQGKSMNHLQYLFVGGVEWVKSGNFEYYTNLNPKFSPYIKLLNFINISCRYLLLSDIICLKKGDDYVYTVATGKW